MIGYQRGYQKYVRLLYEAYDAHKAQDNFDLHSDDITSVIEFNGLLENAKTADKRLVAHVFWWGLAIRNGGI